MVIERLLLLLLLINSTVNRQAKAVLTVLDFADNDNPFNSGPLSRTTQGELVLEKTFNHSHPTFITQHL